MLSRTLLLTLMTGALLAAGSQAKDNEWQKEIAAKPGQTIHLEMKNGGTLEVKGWDKDQVRIVCTEDDNDLEVYDLEAEETKDGVRFRAELNDRNVSSTNLMVQVMVPHEFNIETSSAGGGIDLRDLVGEFRGSTGGGGIILHKLSGEVRLTTGGGTLEIVDSDLDGSVTTGGGGGVVRNVTGNLKATSGGGAVRFENVRGREGDLRGPSGVRAHGAKAGTIMYNTGGGSIDIDEAPDGAIVQTGGGSIDIRNASRVVKANTGGGSINIEIVDGHVKANTGAGDVEVTVREGLGDDRDGIDLNTGSGAVTLIVPANASMEFDLDVSFNRNSRRDFDIVTDFDMKIDRTTEWKREHGSNYWKHVYGTGSVNGGQHLVTIHSVNGNITIKKK